MLNWKVIHLTAFRVVQSMTCSAQAFSGTESNCPGHMGLVCTVWLWHSGVSGVKKHLIKVCC